MRSLAELDTSKLSAQARTALSVVQRVENEGEPIGAVLAELGISEAEHKRAVQQLAHEWQSQGGPITVPPLSSDEYVALRDSIATNGLQYPILRAPEHDNWVVDGEHRERACLELGIEPRYENVYGSRDELQSLALVVNLARRQLTAGARRGIVQAELLRDPARSDRTLAISIGVSPSTVSSVRRELQDDGQVSKLDTSRGRDGKTYPRRREGSRNKPAHPGAATTGAPAGVVVDVTVRVNLDFARDLEASGWVSCNAIRFLSVEPGVYELQVRT